MKFHLSTSFLRTAGLLVGPLLMLYTLLAPAPEGMDHKTWLVAGLAFWMILWWVTEAVPLPVTGLLPLVVYPILEVMPLKQAAAPFASPVIFLFLGGFIMALAIEKTGLHLRIALGIIRIIGCRSDRMVAGFMVATAFLSMWISNTATVIMMLPMALSVVHLLENERTAQSIGSHKKSRNFALCMMLGLAFAASVGGIGTLIGTPPNAILKGYLARTYGYEISFVDWMALGIPFVVVLTFIMWFVLTKLVFPVSTNECEKTQELINDEIDKLGAMSKGEKIVLTLFSLIATAWIFQQPLANGFTLGDFTFAGIESLSDTVIAMVGAILMFCIPLNLKKGEFIITWQDAEKLPWGVLILFAGGLAMAQGFTYTGLGAWIGTEFEHAGGTLPHWLVVSVFVLVCLIFTSLMSNVATITMLLPIVAPIAVSLGENPLTFLVPMTIIASCAFLLPVSTAANAIVFGTGYVSIREMVIGGFFINVIAYALVMLLTFTYIPMIFDIQGGVLPEWATSPAVTK